MRNVDTKTVESFGEEWSLLTQDKLDPAEAARIFNDYFAIFPWQKLDTDAIGADLGCGSGRWARFVCNRVGHLFLCDASDKALGVARQNLTEQQNVSFKCVSVSDTGLESESLDFAYSLGVLHHVPDVTDALKHIAMILKPDAPLLLYLYYSFENRARWFRWLWRVSDLMRRMISRLPYKARYVTTFVLTMLIYWPFVRIGRLLAIYNRLPGSWPLAYQIDKSFYTLRTDCLDRFGTRLERRYSKSEIEVLLKDCGFGQIAFSDREPFWCVVCQRNPEDSLGSKGYST